jgi:hypothetical protein
MEHYIFPYQLSNEVRYLIWVSDDADSKRDHFITDPQGMISAFASLQALEGCAAEKSLPLLTQSSVAPLALDLIVEWLSANGELPECGVLLNAWNAFSDAANSAQRESAFSKLNLSNKHLYNKIFWGNNLPAVTPEGEHYDPIWVDEELNALRSIFATGIDLFISSILLHES